MTALAALLAAACIAVAAPAGTAPSGAHLAHRLGCTHDHQVHRDLTATATWTCWRHLHYFQVETFASRHAKRVWLAAVEPSCHAHGRLVIGHRWVVLTESQRQSRVAVRGLHRGRTYEGRCTR